MTRDVRSPRLVHAQRGGVAIIMLLAFIVLAVPLATAALQTSTQLARSSGVYDRRLTGQYNAASGVEVAIHDALYGPGFDDLSPSDPTKDIQVEVNGENVPVTVTKSYPSGYSDPAPFTPSSAIQVTKSVTPQSVAPDTPTDYTYTISLENTGATPLDINAITDELPLGLTYKGPTSGISIKDPTTNMVAGRQVLRWEVEEGFTWLTQSDDISVTTAGSWQDIDLTTYVPSTAAGVIVDLINTDNSTHRAFVRGKEDTRDYMDGPQDGRLRNRTHRWQMVKLDSNKTIQGYVNDTFVKFKLLGYTTGDDPDYFAVPPDITPATTSAWTMVDVSSQVDADATGIILLVYSESEQDRDYAIREVGSSDPKGNDLGLRRYQSTMHVVGLNASKEFETWLEHSSLKLYLVAQTKDRFTYYVDNIAVADPPLDSWQTMDADDYAIPAAAGGLIMSVESDDYGIMTFRHGDGFDDWGPLSTNVDGDTLVQAPVGLNLANEWEEYMEIAKMDVAIAAWVKGNVSTVAPGQTLTLSFVATGTLSSGSYTNQAAAEMRTLGCRASGLAAPIDVGGGMTDPAKVIRVDKVVTPDLGVGFNTERYTYTITVTNISTGPSVLIVDGVDLLPRFFDYLAGSTLVNNFPDSDPIIALDPELDPANDRQTLSWNLNENLAGGDSLTLEFKATASVDAGEYYNEGWITTDDSYFPCVSSGRAARVTVSNVIDVEATALDGEVRSRLHWWKPQQRADVVSWQE